MDPVYSSESFDPLRLVKAVVDDDKSGGFLFMGEDGVAVANEINSVVAALYESGRSLVTEVDCSLISEYAAIPNVEASGA